MYDHYPVAGSAKRAKPSREYNLPRVLQPKITVHFWAGQWTAEAAVPSLTALLLRRAHGSQESAFVMAKYVRRGVSKMLGWDDRSFSLHGLGPTNSRWTRWSAWVTKVER